LVPGAQPPRDAQFTCFTSMVVQILTQKALVERGAVEHAARRAPRASRCDDKRKEPLSKRGQTAANARRFA
jgi:hypothetical protein